MIEFWQKANFIRRLLIIAGVGLALRLAWAALVPVIPLSDSYIYWITSQNIVNHGTYGIEHDRPFSYWPVGTSGIYALGYQIFGINLIAVQILNILAGLSVIITTGLLARLWFGETVGLLAAAIICLWPSLIFYSTIMASEVFFMAFVNIALLAWYSQKSNFLFRGFVAGSAFAISIYVRPIALLVPIVLAVIDVVRRPATFRKTAFLATISVAIAALALAPWVKRNFDVHDAFVIVSTNGAPNLWMGNNPESNGGYMPLPKSVESMNEIERAEYLGDIAKDYILNHPLRTTLVSINRIFTTHARETIAVVWNEEGIRHRFGNFALTPLKAIATLYWYLALGAALFGILLFTKTGIASGRFTSFLQQVSHPAVVLFAYYTVVHAIVVGGDRYHFPSIPLVAILAAFALVTRMRPKLLKFRNPKI